MALILCLAMFVPAAQGQSWLNQLQNGLSNGLSGIENKLPPPVRGFIGQPANQAQQAVLQQAYEAVGKALGDDLPIKLDASAALPSVAPPLGFSPTPIQCTPSNANMPLPPGDYTCEVRAYCMMDSIHRPGSGVPYELAPLQGKQADAIATLVERGTATGVPPSTLQVIAWSVQASIPLSQMPPQNQQIVHHLIPEYERGLQGDFLQQAEAAYSRVASVARLPPFDAMLDRMGPTGRTIQQIRRSREIIRQNATSYERLSQQLYDGPPDQEVIRPAVPQPSPWSQIRPGVIAQFVVEQGNLGLNRLNFRVLPQRQQRLGSETQAPRATLISVSLENPSGYELAQLSVEQVLTIADIFGMVGTAEVPGGPEFFAEDLARRRARNALIGYSQSVAAQALMMAMSSNNTGNGAPSNGQQLQVKGPPRPSPNFRPPTNPPQPPPNQADIPTGWRVRVMPPDSQYSSGYWRLEKPMANGGWQGINPSTMKPGPEWETHVPLPAK